jgi:3-dehydroquinate dehydratase type I
METIRLGQISVQPPCVVGVADRILSDQELARLAGAGLRVLEIRFDLFAEEFSAVLAFVQRLRGRFGLIGTLRESDANKHALVERYALLSPLVDIVDIEIGTKEPERSSFVKSVRAAGPLLMLSHHDFKKTPLQNELDDFFVQAAELKADLTKLAVYAASREDAARLMGYLESRRQAGQKGVTAFSMGPHGVITRVSAGLHGSIFTYGYIHESAAPGQLSVTDLLRITSELFPTQEGQT